MNNNQIIDLFSGCGGFSLGFHKAGFKTVLAADFDASSCASFGNMSKTSKVINEDITSQNFKKNLKLFCSNLSIPINGVIAGLPCQSFSSVGKAQDKNSMKNDERNYFYKDFFDCIKIINPDFFIFENVSGLMSSKPNGFSIFQDILIKAKKNGYNIINDKKTVLLNSAEFGVPQIRKRVFIIGIKKKLNIDINKIYSDINKLKTNIFSEDYLTVKDAIIDLPSLQPGQGKEKINFISQSNNDYIRKLRRKNSKYLYNHVARNHNDKDKERYRLLAQRKGELIDLINDRPDLVHHDPKHFKNRYTVQDYDNPGKTIVSHLYKDGNLFIHPDFSQNRTFTVREAARIQSFPDSFVFLGSRTNQFKQVGNAVPPLLAKAIGKAIKRNYQ